ncbi:hypothetical protein NP233_g4481 [Leucocoprinus birnbaumii]|uniref:Uncharacterized protein n=1 Tax=Leucocoprinus birnbaumii TaxID=56174 RepID=A0AAD5VUK9_9AGAR|nr:hypothetical protein NP233_g4481 [Leucocoprinus birnbaumii]
MGIEKPSLYKMGSNFQSVALLSNVILNIYATVFVAVRLLKYKKALMAIFGKILDVTTLRSFQIVNILLISAAISIPITITAAVGFCINASYGRTIMPVAVTGQVRSRGYSPTNERHILNTWNHSRLHLL